MYFTSKSGLYRAKVLKTVFLSTIGSLKPQKNSDISPFAAAATALGGTVGVGSIIGVAYGIAVGGAGSLFWMWVCSFFGMGLKYAEVKIALGNRKKTAEGFLGGAPFRLDKLGFKKTAMLFSVFCIAASFGTGNLTQVGAISSFLDYLGANKILSALICTAVITVAVFGGRKRIARINSFIVPIASFIYLAVCLVMLAGDFSKIGGVFYQILSQAFGFSEFVGGFSGALLARSLREGFARSVFSNEAGMGSSPLAHATACSDSPDNQAAWGVFEIFFDTFVVSTLTGLCLLSGGWGSVNEAFSYLLGGFGNVLFGLLIAVFAFASVISWCYYAECCVLFFTFKKSARYVFRAVFVLVAFCGVFLSGEVIWTLADILNLFMLFPNLFLLFKCRNEIERIT